MARVCGCEAGGSHVVAFGYVVGRFEEKPKEKEGEGRSGRHRRHGRLCFKERESTAAAAVGWI